MKSLKDKVALITGADSMIGLLAAQEFLKEGARVIVTVSRDSELSAISERLGDAALGMCVDVSDVEALAKLFERIDKEFGRLDILFPNADLGEYRSSLLEVGLRQHFGIKSLTFTIQKALPLLRDGGSIILITSAVTAEAMMEESAAYVAANAARAFARSLVIELKERHIRVNGVSLGTIDAAKLEHLPATLTKEQQPLPREVTLRRGSSFEQVAAAVVSLLSDESDVAGHELNMEEGKSDLLPITSELLLDRLGNPETVALNVAFLASDTSASINGMELLADDYMIAL